MRLRHRDTSEWHRIFSLMPRRVPKRAPEKGMVTVWLEPLERVQTDWGNWVYRLPEVGRALRKERLTAEGRPIHDPAFVRHFFESSSTDDLGLVLEVVTDIVAERAGLK